MRHSLLTTLAITLLLSAATSTFSATDAAPQSPGMFSSIANAIKDVFSYASRLFSPSENGGLKEPKNSVDLIKDATVSEKLHLEFAGPRGAETPKPTIDLDAIEDKIAPLPKPEEASKPDDSKDLPIRKEMAQAAGLQSMANESHRIEEIDAKILSEMPQVELETTLSAEKAANAPSMNALEAEFTRGNPPPVHEGLDK